MNNHRLLTDEGSPRSGLSENSPALQCWVRDTVELVKPVKRATEVTEHIQSSASRPKGRRECCVPSDKSLGYFHSSAARTILLTAFIMFANSPSLAQDSAPSPTPAPMISAQQTMKLPVIAIDYRADATKPLPALTRIGVDVDQQKPITLREAIVLALSNNKDIEIARDNVQLAEADLLTVRGAYDPRFTAQSYYERFKSPATSVLSGASVVINDDFTNTARVEGLAPNFGGNYRVDFSSIRQTTNSQFTALNPSYPTALTFSFTQPLLRGRGYDLPRRNIEVAKKNLSLTDAQFRQRSIEVITQVQRSYWDLVFTLRNLQIQRESLNDARTQLEHNRRMVGEGALAPIDIIAEIGRAHV